MLEPSAVIQNRWVAGPSFSVLAVAVAAGMVVSPIVTLAAVVVITAVGCGFVLASRLQGAWLSGLGIMLVGYVVLGKGFAYIGLPPLYVGEVVVAWGILAAFLGGGMSAALRSPVTWCWAALALDGTVRTLPYLQMYGMDAVRDTVVWAYGLVALLVAAFLVRSGRLSRVPESYARILPWFLLWLPCAVLIQTIAEPAIPRLPVSGMPLLNVKWGDAAVHLAGVSSFLLVGLHDLAAQRRGVAGRQWKEWVLWLLWFVGVGLTGSASRSGLLSVLAATFVVVLLRPQSLRKLGKAILIIATVFVLTFSFDIEFNLGVKGSRTIGPNQIMSNFRSALGIEEQGGNEQLQGTKNWRLEWWNGIIDYTVFGPYFWTGKGYGINLADDDGFQGTGSEVLRSPHNVHMTILARAGVPGLTLWAILHGLFCVGLVRAYLRARRLGLHWWAAFDLWILAYWTAFLVNASFDVFLEGPQAGIWFWSLVGVGLALIEYQKRCLPAGHLQMEKGRSDRGGLIRAPAMIHRRQQ